MFAVLLSLVPPTSVSVPYPHIVRLCMPTQTYTMPTIRGGTLPTCTAKIPLVPLPTSCLVTQPSPSSPQISAHPSGPNASASVAAAASPPARPTSNLPSNNATTNPRPLSKPTRSKQHSPAIILAWIGVALAVVGLILTMFYGKPTMLLARWTAGNDYRESCRNDRDDGVLLDGKCKEALSHPPKPPPIRREEVHAWHQKETYAVSPRLLVIYCVLSQLLPYMYKTSCIPTMLSSLVSKVTHKLRSGRRIANYLSCHSSFALILQIIAWPSLTWFVCGFIPDLILFEINRHVIWALISWLLAKCLVSLLILIRPLRWIGNDRLEAGDLIGKVEHYGDCSP